MAATKPYQGKDLGKDMLEVRLDKARTIKAKKVYLVSNTKLKAAIGLQRKHRFITVQPRKIMLYSRVSIVMELKT